MHISLQADPETKAIYMVVNRKTIPTLVYFAPHEFYEIRGYLNRYFPGTAVFVDREEPDEGDSSNRP